MRKNATNIHKFVFYILILFISNFCQVAGLTYHDLRDNLVHQRYVVYIGNKNEKK